MIPFQSSIIIILCSHLFLSMITATTTTTYSSHPPPLENIFLNCGSSGSSTAITGQKWIGDVDLKPTHLVSRQSTGRLIKSLPIDKLLTAVDPVPYGTAQLSMFDFTYTFQVSPGPKIIRLHFYPASFPDGFQRSNSLFTVKAGPYTLLSNFSASSTADDLGLKVFTKEFCIPIELEAGQQPLRISFSPSNSSSSSYAFINGIEVVSMPTGLYYTPIGDVGAEVVGQKYRFVVGENTAMELVKRLNVGGSPISPTDDPGMFREWSDDTVHLQGSDFSPIRTTAWINYKEMSTFIAPQRVYQTSWSVDPSKQVSSNFTWRLSVDSGFRYLVRLHFCELHYEIMDSGKREFSIIINDQMAESNRDLIKWAGEIGVAVYKDYVVEMEGREKEGRRDLFVTICSHQNPEMAESNDAILKALELFKLSNPDNNLAGVNPVVFSQRLDHHKSWFVPIVGHGTIVTIIVTLLSTLIVIVYAIRVWNEKICKENISSPQLGVLCRCFSLSELRSATNNFDDRLVIGRGGFGKVYKGCISIGVVAATSVAIKRLNKTSGQGATEFLTEIEMLSNFKDTHVVSLIGYCCEKHEMILVYEYMKRGTLADHLYKINHEGNHVLLPLSWDKRLSICLGAASGLNYLHTGGEKSIIHRDVKSTNILLDENWVAKISDFGLCKTGTTSHSYTHISTTVKGTIGYLDPDYFLNRRLTRKSDVFAFGVVMLEIICGRPALDTTFEGGERNLERWAKEYLEKGTVEDIIDPNLRGRVPRCCLNTFANVAKECLYSHPNDRPTMADIVANLQNALGRLCQDSDCRTKEAEVVQLVPDDPDHELCSSSIAQRTVPSTSNSLQIVQNKVQKQSKKKNGGINSARMFERAGLALSIDSDFIRNNSDKVIFPEIQSQLYRKFTVSEILEATDNFSSSCSIQGSWMFYKGTTSDGTTVAIRRMNFSTPTLRDSIRSEFLAQNNQLRHINVMPLIGYCIFDDIVVFVHDFMANGSLYHQLQRTNNSLQWKKLLEICIGVAQGLWYLHSRRIIHCKMRPIFILLDENWVPKISNFGSSMFIPDGNNTCGYSNPSSKLTEKIDIYGFGGILVGVLMGTLFMRNSYNYFPLWLNTSIQEKDIDKIISSNLMGKIAPECLMMFIKVAWDCVHYSEADTFYMDNVLARLQEALQLQQNWKGDNFSGTYNDVLNLETNYFSS